MGAVHLGPHLTGWQLVTLLGLAAFTYINNTPYVGAQFLLPPTWMYGKCGQARHTYDGRIAKESCCHTCLFFLLIMPCRQVAQHFEVPCGDVLEGGLIMTTMASRSFLFWYIAVLTNPAGTLLLLFSVQQLSGSVNVCVTARCMFPRSVCRADCSIAASSPAVASCVCATQRMMYSSRVLADVDVHQPFNSKRPADRMSEPLGAAWYSWWWQQLLVSRAASCTSQQLEEFCAHPPGLANSTCSGATVLARARSDQTAVWQQ